MVLKGDTNIRYLLERNNHIWDEWAFERYVKRRLSRTRHDGFWASCLTRSSVCRTIQRRTSKLFCDAILNDAEFAEKYGELGEYLWCWRHWETKDGSFIDQLANVIEMIKTNPDSRRLIVSAWNPEDVPSMALPPCHYVSILCK